MPYADREKQQVYLRTWRQNHPDYHREYDATHARSDETLRKKRIRGAERYREKKGPTVFVGVDGEGMGDGYDHKYYTLRVGSSLLSDPDSLASYDCLSFIAQQPHGPIYTIYSGNYDFTMWLRDAPEAFVRDLLNRQARTNGKTVRPARWLNLRVDYIPHKRLSARLDDGPPIVVHDVFGFFQCSFVDAISPDGFGGYGGWNVGTEQERALISEGKRRRGNTDVLSPEDIEYNRIECKLLAELMHKFNDTAEQVMLSASPYEGAGSLATSLYNMYVAKPVKERNRVARNQGRPTESVAPPDFADLMPSWDAYYGGRFEITAHGPVPGPVYEYDINSAYPAAIEQLPCLRHGRWETPETDGPQQLRNATSHVRPGLPLEQPVLGLIEWRMPEGTPLGPLPHRNKQSNVTYPLNGRGWYWSVEWPDDPDTYSILGYYKWISNCDCVPYHWIRQVYQARKQHKLAGRLGAATSLKLAYNSLYGKLAQQVGAAPWRNSILAGLVTAQTRRWVRDAAMQAPEHIIMIATDGVYSTTPLDLPLGGELGQWESHTFDSGLHLVRPGIYFTADGETKVKTRGISRRTIQENAAAIIEAFGTVHAHPEWLEPPYLDDQWGIDLSATGMISLRLAYSQNRPKKAGYVGVLPHRMSYSMRPKRLPLGFDGDGVLRSAPPHNGMPFESIGHLRSVKPAHDDEEVTASAPDNVHTQLSLF